MNQKYSEEHQLINKNIAELGSFDSKQAKDQIDRLQKDLALIEKIEILLEDIGEDLPNLAAMKDSLAEIDSKIQEHLMACHLNQVPERKELDNWNAPLQCLSYLTVFEKVIPALEACIKEIDHTLTKSDPPWLGSKKNEDSLASLNNIYSQMPTVIDRVEKVVGFFEEKSRKNRSFDLHFRESTPKRIKKPSSTKPVGYFHQETIQLFKLVNGFFSFGKKTIDQKSVESVQKLLHIVHIDLTRCLRYFEELNLSRIKTDHQKKRSLENILERYKNKQQRLQEEWVKISDILNINRNLSLSSYLDFINRYQSLILLNEDAQALRKNVDKVSSSFKKLTTLLSSWFDETDSHKHVCLGSPSIVLGEAQNLVRYKQEKKKLLASLIEKQVAFELDSLWMARLSRRMTCLREEWQQLCSKGSLKGFDIEQKKVEDFFHDANIFKGLKHLREQLHWTNGQELVSCFTPEWNYEPLCLWYINQVQINAHSKIIEQLQLLPKNSIHVIVSEHRAVVDQLLKIGAGRVSSSDSVGIEPELGPSDHTNPAVNATIESIYPTKTDTSNSLTRTQRLEKPNYLMQPNNSTTPNLHQSIRFAKRPGTKANHSCFMTKERTTKDRMNHQKLHSDKSSNARVNALVNLLNGET